MRYQHGSKTLLRDPGTSPNFTPSAVVNVEDCDGGGTPSGVQT